MEQQKVNLLSDQLGVSAHSVLNNEQEREAIRNYIFDFIKENPLNYCVELIRDLLDEASERSALQSRDYICVKCDKVIKKIEKEKLYESTRL